MRYRALSLLLFTSLLAGCSGSVSERNELRRELAAQKERLAQLEEERTRDMETFTARIASLHATLEETKKQLEETNKDCRQRIQLKDERIAHLMEKLTEERALTRELRAAQASGGPPVRDGERPPVNSEVFPVKVSNIKGLVRVEGSHTRPRTVPTDETYRDEFGEKQPVMDIEEVTVNQYRYAVSFDLENLTDRALQVTARAGAETREFALQPGQTLTELTIDSARGSGLLVMVGGYLKRLDVTYEE
jgi:hypothetical protein